MCLTSLTIDIITFLLSVVVVISFFVCWSPFHTQRLMFVIVTLYSDWSSTLVRAQHILFMVSGIASKSVIISYQEYFQEYSITSILCLTHSSTLSCLKGLEEAFLISEVPSITLFMSAFLRKATTVQMESLIYHYLQVLFHPILVVAVSVMIRGFQCL